ncbi:MAG: HAD hydrolase-like protein [Deltaproteobacteria bacterium]|nr:HAD hydrolase-like protein [Deltaproteobacteria bacterium]
MFERIDAVVLDLDDTLFDTTGQLMEPAHREAAQAMIDAGLVADLEGLVQLRLELQRGYPTEDTNVLAARAHGHGADAPMVHAARDTYYRRRIESLDPFPGTIPLLNALHGRCKLLLLTTGHPGTQRSKVTLLEIAHYFDDMVFLTIDEADKRAGLRSLLRYHKVAAPRTVVVGDRIDREIAAGRALGTWTVRVDGGEGGGVAASHPQQRPHYTVSVIEALAPVLDDIEEGDEVPEAVPDPKSSPKA